MQSQQEQNEQQLALTKLSLTSSKQTKSVREILGNLPSSTTSRLAPILSSLLTDRIDPSALLPATQDERANAEVMAAANMDTGSGAASSAKSAKTISRLGMTACRTYIELIGRP
eukprot:11966460-Ditylum_brightwellii.AAC.1